MRKLFISITISSFIFSSCNLSDPYSFKKVEYPPEAEVVYSTLLVGEWTFMKATGGITGSTKTPDVLGYTPRLVVYDNRKAHLYSQDSVLVSYNVIWEKPDSMEEGRWGFRPKTNEENSGPPIISYTIKLNDKELVLKDSCSDCYITYFKKAD